MCDAIGGVGIDGRYVVRARDSELTDIDSRSQWDPSAWVANGQPVSFHDWVRAALAVPGAPRDPESDYREMVESLCRDIVESDVVGRRGE